MNAKYRKLGIATEYLKKFLETAIEKYIITKINGETYHGKNGMPYSWYRSIGITKKLKICF